MNYTSDDMPRKRPEFDDALRGNPRLAEYVRQLEEDNARLRDESITDPLTGSYNFRFFQQRLDEEMEGALRYNRTLALVLDDIDHFKAINDTYGHHVGDEVLRRLSDIKQRKKRLPDSVYRKGGEEGATILPGIAIDGAVKVADAVRHSIGEYDLWEEIHNDLSRYAGKKRCTDSEERRYRELEAVLKALVEKPELQITISQGIGVYPDTDIRTAAGLIAQTDRALYRAKALGRNRACTIYELGNDV